MFSTVKLDGSDMKFVIDTFDLPKVKQHKWELVDNRVIESPTALPSSLPHFILDAKEHKRIEYGNGNVLDCRRNNIRALSKRMYDWSLEMQKVFEPGSLHWNSDKKCFCIKAVYMKYRLGFFGDRPTFDWTNENRKAYDSMIETREPLPYDEPFKTVYNHLMAPLEVGASYR